MITPWMVVLPFPWNKAQIPTKWSTVWLLPTCSLNLMLSSCADLLKELWRCHSLSACSLFMSCSDFPKLLAQNSNCLKKIFSDFQIKSGNPPSLHTISPLADISQLWLIVLFDFGLPNKNVNSMIGRSIGSSSVLYPQNLAQSFIFKVLWFMI